MNLGVLECLEAQDSATLGPGPESRVLQQRWTSKDLGMYLNLLIDTSTETDINMMPVCATVYSDPDSRHRKLARYVTSAKI